MTVTKAIIPVAGWGTRMLPITKAIEKMYAADRDATGDRLCGARCHKGRHYRYLLRGGRAKFSVAKLLS